MTMNLFKWSRKTYVFAIVIALFVVGQIAGTIAIRLFFLDYKMNELSPKLQEIATDIATDSFVGERNTDFILKAYDLYGAAVDIFKDSDEFKPMPLDTFIDQSLTPLIPKVIGSRGIATIVKIKGHPSKSMLIGMPIVREKKVEGVAFLLKPASDFAAVLNGFYLIFTLTLALGTGAMVVFMQLYFKEAKRLEQMRKDYMANVSHELKSPIASIKALAETLLDHMVQDEETKDKYYDSILKESHTLQRLISDMLELSKLQSGKRAFKLEYIETVPFVKQIVSRYIALSEDLDIRFTITERALEAPPIYSNPHRLSQLLRILIDNAMRFVQEGGSITLDIEPCRHELIFRIIDTGCGIDEASLPYIFDRFYQVSPSEHGVTSGLGLSIAKEIVKYLDQSISVSSEVGKGSIFYFTVKRAHN